jgi:hypothetical protein
MRGGRGFCAGSELCWDHLRPSWGHLGAKLEPCGSNSGHKMVQKEARAMPIQGSHRHLQPKEAISPKLLETAGTSLFLKGQAARFTGPIGLLVGLKGVS